MVISEDIYNFWTILELDLRINVQDFIKNSLRYDLFQKYKDSMTVVITFCKSSFSGYGNAFVFQDMNDADIISIENYVKINLMDIIQSGEFTKQEKMCLFGPFSSEPNQFMLLPDAREQIVILVKHVKEMIVIKGPAYFTSSQAVPEYDYSENLTQSALGTIFCDNLKHRFPESVSINIQSGNIAEGQENNLVNDTLKKLSATHRLLSKLKETADQNILRKKAGYRFPDDLKSLAVYIRINGGKMVYETIQKNLELSLPSLDTTNRIIRKMKNAIVEGRLRTNELLEYLNDRGLPLAVTLAEDATGIEGRVQYDPKTNQVTGLTLPLDENGMPIPLAYPAKNGMEIVNHFHSNNTIARYVIVIMAKPLANFPAFPLLIFSSDNRFKTIHVTKRWNYIVNELKKVNIEVLSISSDSDPRYNGAMRISSMLGKTSNIFNADWFCSGLSELFKGPFTFQDVLHIITKLRNLILRTLYYRGKLPIGDQNFVQIAHLQFLLNNFSKDEHQLTQSILDPVDKQNVASALRMCDSKVIGLLKEHLTTSDGTVLFLEMMQSIVDSFYDYKLLPLDRIAKMWYPNFILRLWRDYIESQPNLTVRDNFVTPATYACIEVNAHSIVQLIIHLKNDGLDEWFLPFLYDSQACESFFRQVRSLTTVHCRVANCSVKEIIARMNRIQL